MISSYGPVQQALLGTLFTWGLTAAGASLVFVFKSGKRKVLDGSLGFAAGVMIAASYWSLLAPAIEMAVLSGNYGKEGEYAFIPVAVGFAAGALFVYAADILMPFLGNPMASIAENPKIEDLPMSYVEVESNGTDNMEKEPKDNKQGTTLTQRKKSEENHTSNVSKETSMYDTVETQKQVSWKRILLLIIAITVHNIPEGLAVGVGFGAIGKSASATFENARNLAIGIGIQNFPEGLAVSLPLRGAGMSVWKSFWYGQLSGMVEPIAGVLGAYAVVVAEPLLPYALAFAAGAMIYVVNDDIIPEAQTGGNGKLASWTSIVGFIVMMSLDVGLG
ncbi:zinc transporter ZIP11-like isoform X1 [Styela clava]